MCIHIYSPLQKKNKKLHLGKEGKSWKYVRNVPQQRNQSECPSQGPFVQRVQRQNPPRVPGYLTQLTSLSETEERSFFFALEASAIQSEPEKMPVGCQFLHLFSPRTALPQETHGNFSIRFHWDTGLHQGRS